MKLDLLPSGSPDCPLIRLYAYEPDDVARLRRACLDLGDGRIAAFSLHEQPWIRTIAGCRSSGVLPPGMSA